MLCLEITINCSYSSSRSPFWLTFRALIAGVQSKYMHGFQFDSAVYQLRSRCFVTIRNLCNNRLDSNHSLLQLYKLMKLCWTYSAKQFTLHSALCGAVGFFQGFISLIICLLHRKRWIIDSSLSLCSTFDAMDQSPMYRMISRGPENNMPSISVRIHSIRVDSISGHNLQKQSRTQFRAFCGSTSKRSTLIDVSLSRTNDGFRRS